MMTKRFELAIVGLSAVLATACTSLPETPREKSVQPDGAVRVSVDAYGETAPSAPLDGSGAVEVAIEAGEPRDLSDEVERSPDGAVWDTGNVLLDSALPPDAAADVVVAGGEADTSVARDGKDVPIDSAAADAPWLGPSDVPRTSCGMRNCRSADDNNCNGQPDNTEPECACPSPNESKACNTGLAGDCATGTAICIFATDNRSSSWGACTASNARARNCTSVQDNNCNGQVDSTEPECACPTPNQTKSCSTGLPGICAAGTTTCNFAADKSTSSWGPCTASKPQTVNCTSALDNDCNGTPDNSEAACEVCNQASPRACNSHPGHDGIGTCTPGSQTVVKAADNSECHWSACTGDQGPTTGELCGPEAPDLNCDGTPGNGTCLKLVHIYSSSHNYGCGCSSSGSIAAYVAQTTSPGGGWTDYSQFYVFPDPRPTNSIPVLNCVSGSTQYVTIAETCPGASTPVGYVSLLQANNYVPLTQTTLNEPCGGTQIATVPLGPGKTSSVMHYYTVSAPSSSVP